MDNFSIVTSHDNDGDIPINRNMRVLQFLYNLGLKWNNGEDKRLIHVDDFRWLYIRDNRITYSTRADAELMQRDELIADMSHISNEEV